MREQLLQDKLVDALSGLIVLFAVVDLLITEVLGDEIREGLQGLETNVLLIRFYLLDDHWEQAF